MAEQLFLNKKVVDLLPKPITRKIQIGDTGDIAARKSAFSYSIKLPRTSRNVQIFDMLGVVGNTSRKPYENIVADYIVDGVPLVSDGYVVISSANEFFEINIYDGVIDLGERLKGKKLSDLPLADLDHILTAQGVVDSFANTDGFIYGLADFGLGIGSSVKAEKVAPSVYTHSLFRKIFEAAGLNLTGSFFEKNDKYLKEVVTPVKGYEVQDQPFTSTAKGSVNTNILSQYEVSDSFISFERQFTPSGSMTGASVNGQNLVFNTAGTYKIELDVSFSSYKTYLVFRVKINNRHVASSFLASQSNSGSGTKKVVVTFTVAAGDEVQFWLSGSSENSSSELGYAYEQPIDEQNENPSYYEVNYTVSASGSLFLQEGGQLIQIKNSIGDTGQLDFVKDVVKRFGLVLHPVRNSKNYRFVQLEALLNDRATVEDWTGKYKQTADENYVSGYAQKNKAVYQYPEEIVVPNNDGELLIDNENAAIEKTLFSSIFQIPNQLKTKIGGEAMFSIPVWELKEGVVELKETPVKTMSVKRIDTTVNVSLFDDVTSVSASAGIPVLSLENMSMAYYVGNYYKAFQALINSFKEVEFGLNLSTVDVFNLNFFRLKFLKQTGRFYYLNSVTHTPNKVSKVVMIEISEFPVNQPPSQVGNVSFSMSHDSTRKVTADALLKNYLDPELDPALKVKFIDGFNSNLVMMQDGVEVTAETEILVKDLNLTFFDALGGLDAYSESWSFTVADEGSGAYSSEIGTLTGNVIEMTNTPPVARAGDDQTKGLYVEGSTQDLYFYLSGAASYDNTGEIVRFVWSLESRTNGSPNAQLLTQDFTTPSATFKVPNEFIAQGTYVLKLVVTDEYGATAEDTVNLEVTQGNWYGDGTTTELQPAE